MDAEVRSVRLPRLAIQPFVENSIHNGLKRKPPPWRVAVACRSVGERWEIEIADNGCGIDEETTRQLLQRLTRDQTESAYAASHTKPEIYGIAVV